MGASPGHGSPTCRPRQNPAARLCPSWALR
jgi:hypothetical protein